MRARRAWALAPVIVTAIALGSIALSGGAASAGLATGSGDGGIQLDSIGEFSSPVSVAFAPGSPANVYVVEQSGTVRSLVGGVEQPQPFLDIRNRTGFQSCEGGACGEQGLLSIAFSPDFASNGAVYAYYTNTKGDIEVDEFLTNSPTDADESSRSKVIQIQHRFASNHNGGTVAFGPDGYLYLGTGDGGIADDPRQKGQDKEALLAKLLRLDVSGDGTGGYKIPPGNPYRGKPGRNEIMAIGLRNPYRFSFDPLTSRIAIGDVGQNSWEEVDYETLGKLAGANFGWDRWEGKHLHKGPGPEAKTPKAAQHDEPIHEYSHSKGCSITGGVVVRDPQLSTLYGRYVYADFCAGKLRSLVPALSKASDDHAVGVEINSPVAFAQSPTDKQLYAVSLDGTVFEINPD